MVYSVYKHTTGAIPYYWNKNRWTNYHSSFTYLRGFMIMSLES